MDLADIKSKIQIDRKFLRKYYEEEALAENRQRIMYEGNKWESYWHIILQKRIIETVRELDIKNFLDVGCAEGLYIKLFENKGDAVGIDIAKNYLKKAKLVSNNASFIQAEIKNLPFKDRKFDLVLCTETLEHVLNPKESFSEILRVSNGNIIVSFPGHTLFFYVAKYFKFIKDDDSSEMFLVPGKGHINNISIDLIKEWLEWLNENGNDNGKEFVFTEKFIYCYIPPEIAKKLHIPIFLLKITDKIISKIPIINKKGLVQYAVIQNKK